MPSERFKVTSASTRESQQPRRPGAGCRPPPPGRGPPRRPSPTRVPPRSRHLSTPARPYASPGEGEEGPPETLHAGRSHFYPGGLPRSRRETSPSAKRGEPPALPPFLPPKNPHPQVRWLPSPRSPAQGGGARPGRAARGRARRSPLKRAKPPPPPLALTHPCGAARRFLMTGGSPEPRRGAAARAGRAPRPTGGARRPAPAAGGAERGPSRRGKGAERGCAAAAAARRSYSDPPIKGGQSAGGSHVTGQFQLPRRIF